ncbi:MAG: DciA family protein [Chromatiales bacterium]|jgi:hypothetical protein
MNSITKILHTQGSLTQLNRQLAQQQRLAERVRDLLPPPLNEQLLAAVLNDRRLTLLVQSPVWASRLRYLAPQLLRQLRQQGLLVEQLHPRIVPAEGKTRKSTPRKASVLSPQNAKLLRQTAEALEAGPLREALLKLSRHQNR